jgi:hypothetical protein
LDERLGQDSSGHQPNILSTTMSKAKKKQNRYDIHNYYYATCNFNYPKEVLMCSDCNHRIRITGRHTGAWHQSDEAIGEF